MMRLQPIDLHCPVCHTYFRSQAAVATSAFARKRTDLQERASGSGTQPLPFLIHTCTRCGYSGAKRDFNEDVDVSPAFEARVWNELAPRLTSGLLPGSGKYEAAAKIAAWRGDAPRRVADLLLRAAWCCVDEEDTEAERYFRRQAARRFEEALSTYDGVRRDERALLTYLIGELWRRVGDVKRATAWFDRVSEEVVDDATQRWVVDTARQQRDAPREWLY